MVLKLNENQEAILRRYNRESIISDLLEHCAERELDFMGRITKERLREIVREIVNRAERLGFDGYGAIRLYMNMVWSFGWDFENDPQYPWVHETFDRYKARGEIILAEELDRQMVTQMTAMYGPYPETQHRVDALRCVLEGSLPIQEDDFGRSMTECLRTVWPQKYDTLGAALVENICERWREKAREEFRYSMTETQALVILSFYMLGQDFLHNPLYETWATPEKLDASIAGELEALYNLQAGLRRGLSEELAGILDPVKYTN